MSMSWAALPDSIGNFTLGSTLGIGAFSLVKRCTDKTTSAVYAVKIIPKSSITTEQALARFEREVRAIIKLHHPGIIKIHAFLTDDLYCYLVMEHCPGDTLLSNLGQMTHTEDFIRSIVKQILATVAHIHREGVAHRDLKLENILFDATGHIKVIDFGFSRFVTPGELFGTPCGSAQYVAPEVISGQSYEGRAVDMWSCGVIIYALMTNYFPWRGSNQAHILRQILSGDFQIPDSVGVLCADLIRKLMTIDPRVRLTADEALTHPWLETIEVTWNQDDCLVPQLSERSFTCTLRSTQSGMDVIFNGKAPGLLTTLSKVVHSHSFKPARATPKLVGQGIPRPTSKLRLFCGEATGHRDIHLQRTMGTIDEGAE
jgi:serine/threonine protein kinase